MTVAVSVAAGVDNIISAVPGLNPYRVVINIGFVALLTAMNLRGVRESGRTFAMPTYLFVVGVLSMIAIGLGRTLFGDAPVAESAGWQIKPEPAQVGLTGSPCCSSDCARSPPDARRLPGGGDLQRRAGVPAAQG